MVMQKKILFYLLIFNLSVSVLSQDYQFISHEKLSWNITDTSLTFEGAVYLPEQKNIPYFSKMLSFTSEKNIQITNMVFEKINLLAKYSYFSSKINTKILKTKNRNVFNVHLLFCPIIYDSLEGSLKILKSFDLISETLTTSYKAPINFQYAENSVLASGKWYKIGVTKNGLYKITYSQLKSWGFSNFSNIEVYGNRAGMLPKTIDNKRVDDLISIPIYIEKGNDGVFNDGDYIIFYAEGPNVWNYDFQTKRYKHLQHKFSNYQYYFITDSKNPSKQIQSQPTIDENSNTLTINKFDDFDYVEPDEVNFLRSGAEWYGSVFSNRQTRSFQFSFTQLSESDSIYIYYDLISTAINSFFTLNVGNQTKTISKFIFRGAYYQFLGSLGVNSVSPLNITLTFNGSSANALGYVNYIGVNVVRKLKFTGNQLIIRNKNTLYHSGNVKYMVENANSDVKVWDITSPLSPVLMPTQLSGNILTFVSNADTLRQFIIYSSRGDFYAPEPMGEVENQNIHGASTPDLVIVSPTDKGIYEQAKRLANYRKVHDGLDVLLVTTQQVYNEFSTGARDVTAIRNMVKMFYDRGLGQDKMRYLLLFGKGTYANHIDREGNYNLIPTYQSAESLNDGGSYVTDDFFGWMHWQNPEYDNLIEVAVGRLPVKDSIEAKVVVDKLIRYDNPANDGDWKNIITFVADDEDYGLHLTQAETIANSLEKNYPYLNIKKIYLDAFVQKTTGVGDRYPDANNLLNSQINNGLLILNYTGHGSEVQLAHEDIIDVPIIRSWNNANRLPLFITATCEFSRFDDMNLGDLKTRTSAGEEVLLNPDGGAIGLLTTTRLVYADDNFDLNTAFYKYAFQLDENGTPYRLGDIFRMTKNNVVYTGINRLNFSLLADPSMILANPKEDRIQVDSIVNANSRSNDTLNALSLVTVYGHINDQTDNQSFQGIVYVTVFDKTDTIQTLGNDEKSPKIRFITRQNIIYRGKAEVENGKFMFQFPVPKDIRYHMGKGKMIFYAANYNNSYGGCYDNFWVGGINQSVEFDNQGPVIRLFMNDTNFRDGSITDPNPRLLAILNDKDGINATGIGLGHDLMAYLDNNISNVLVLNDYYESNLGDYTTGKVIYPFSNLPVGKHQLTFIAYDIFNNYSTATLNFEVVENQTIKLVNVMNYPNPTNQSTNFVLKHNWPNKNIRLEIQIYSMNGQLVNRLTYKGSFDGYVTNPIYWNGNDMNGRPLNQGLYMYKVVLINENGESDQKFGKILIIR